MMLFTLLGILISLVIIGTVVAVVVSRNQKNKSQLDNITLREALMLWFQNQIEAEKKYGKIKDWNTSGVTNMRQLFLGKENFNQLLNWDTSNVTTMEEMFLGCTNYNQPINFNVPNLRTSSKMFYRCKQLNQPIYFKNSSLIEDMNQMFRQCAQFNQSIKFDATNLATCEGMFMECESLNQPIMLLNSQNLKNVYGMFKDCVDFNSPITIHFDSLTTATEMFKGCSSMDSVDWTLRQNKNEFSINLPPNCNIMMMFSNSMVEPLKIYTNGELQGPLLQDTSIRIIKTDYGYFVNNTIQKFQFNNKSLRNAIQQYFKNKTQTESMFGPIGRWDTSQVTDMSELFKDRVDFNEKLMWNTEKVTTMKSMFQNCKRYDQPIDMSCKSLINASGMFENCQSLNKKIILDNTTNLKDVIRMFANCTNFSASLQMKDTFNIIYTDQMFENCISLREFIWNETSTDGFFTSIVNFPKLESMTQMFKLTTNLVHPFKLQTTQTLEFGIPHHDNRFTIDESSIIYIPPIVTENITRLVELWTQSPQLVEPYYNHIRNWDTSQVDDMTGLFFQNQDFNEELLWDLRNVKSTKNMFAGCINLNKKCVFKNCQSLETCEQMFYGCVNLNGMVSLANCTNLKSCSKMMEKCVSFNQSFHLKNTTKLEDTSALFWECKNFNNVFTIDFSKVKNCLGMFFGCTSLEGLKLNGFAITNTIKLPVVKNISEMVPKSLKHPLKIITNSQNVKTEFAIPMKAIETNYGFLISNVRDVQFDNDTLKSAVDEYFTNSKKAISKYGFIETWDTSEVTNMDNLFQDKTSFNHELFWDTAKVTSMKFIFNRCTTFNQNIYFNLESVKCLNGMFNGCIQFNRTINFDLPLVENCDKMFQNCSQFNSPIQLTSCKKLIQTQEMMRGCINFNKFLTISDTTRLTGVFAMFRDCKELNKHPRIDFSKIISTYQMFQGCTNLQKLNDMRMPNVTTLAQMFEGCTSFTESFRIIAGDKRPSFLDVTKNSNLDFSVNSSNIFTFTPKQK